MTRLQRVFRVATVVLLAGCTGDSPLAPDGAAHGGGRTGFYFLPPMVPNPGPFSGTFDPGLAPTAEICPLDAAGAACAGAPVATLATGTGPEAIKVDVSGGSYNANWKGSAGLDPSRHYRLQVFVDPDRSGPLAHVLLGFADIDVVESAKQARQVDNNQFVPPVKGHPLPVKFRIETGTVGMFTVAPASATLLLGSTPPRAWAAAPRRSGPRAAPRQET